MNLKTAIEQCGSFGIYAKPHPEANAFTFDSEAAWIIEGRDEALEPPWIFFCDGGYVSEHLELHEGVDKEEAIGLLIDEINDVEFPKGS